LRRIPQTTWGLAVFSGILQVLVFPTPALSWLCWVALAPLILAILGLRSDVQVLDASGRDLRLQTLGQGFLLGYSAGILWYVGTCYWVYHVMNVYGGLPRPVALGILVLFCLYLGLYHGFFGLLLALAARRKSVGVRGALVLAPFLWVAVELARSRITGFPWDLLGTAQVGNIPLSRIATVTGVYGISFEIALVNAALAAAFVLPLRRRTVPLAGTLAAALLLQAFTLVHPRPEPADRVATLVQENIPILDAEAWTSEFFEHTLADLTRLSIAAAPAENRHGKPGLIVWPESPAPFFTTDPRFRRAVSEMAERAGAYVVAGSLGTRFAPQRERPPELLNSAALVAPNGDWAGRYDKIHLVPFGEYVPFKSLLGFAEKLTREVGDFGRGTDRTPLNLGDYRLGAFICYESVFPDEIRQFAAGGAQVLINISNDGWFGESGAPAQHLNMARMRAIENRRWLLRSTNTGITASIDPYGRVVARAPRHERIALQAPYAAISETTFYTRHGDWFAYGCAIISVLGLALRFHASASGRTIWSKS
jgi:apolipoprotein N-acyltransferase